MNNLFEFISENPYVLAANQFYRSEFNEDAFLEKIYQLISYDISDIKQELICVFNDLINIAPCCYWNKDILCQTVDNINTLITSNPSLVITEEMMELYVMAYNAFIQVTYVINDLSGLNFRNTIKNRQYRLPTYVSIVEGCLTQLFRFITLFIDQTTQKDYHSHHKLEPLCQVLVSNGFDKLTQYVDIKIRNSINHGGTLFLKDGDEIVFHYNENHQSISKTIRAYEFDDIINNVYDTASAVLFGISIILNQNWNLITNTIHSNSYLEYNLLGMKLSIPSVRCRYISEVEHANQLNAEFDVVNTDRTYLFRLAVTLAILIYSQQKKYDKYHITFSSERLMTSWVRFSNKQLSDLLDKKRSISDIIKEVSQNETVIFDTSTEPLNMHEIKYFRFPDYQCDLYKINDVSDSSLLDRKRLRCKLFIGNISDRETILKIINKSIDWVKSLKNVDSPTIHHKCGIMEADSVYMNVYRQDTRRNRELMPNNENFVCFVDYNNTGETTLQHGGIFQEIWEQFNHEKIGKLRIAWRENKYRTIHKTKIGVNEPCPCGSGKKYKKCCRWKGIYD